MYIEMQEAIFLGEEKHRFLCKIIIDGEEKLCHVPSSAKLRNFLDLKENKALVTLNTSKNCRTDYKLMALYVDEQWVLVNLSIVNNIVKEFKEKQGELVASEKKVSKDYKSDLIVWNELSQKERLVEIKSIIAMCDNAIVPHNSGERAIRQLKYLLMVLKKDFNLVEYDFVLLNENIKRIEINKQEKEFRRLFKQCVKKGMKTCIYQIFVKKNYITIYENHEIEIFT